MRAGTVLVLIAGLLPLLGCASLPPRPPRGDPANCRVLFQNYDRAASLFQPYTYSARLDGRSTQTPALSVASNAIISNGCLTTTADLKGLESLQMKLGPRKPAESGAPIPPTAVHVGILTGGFSDAGRATAFFQSQGYETRTIGAEKLGRRLYIGPVRSEGALDQAIALAAEAGFPSAYPSDLFHFWKY
ncbi:hypothetical protein [Amaricoccus solimangrovi]|uniref:Uncharacterized protein n=1 Tax=Amaricoccus solimangrovi TaxID=2589815 RepID=A0A501WQ20_9RHOB|nr:hypothetical protein [Amaricoccus solimangrovi]TPE50425.1 hypothetical protein FJM51_11540 [Amaricoccus solimangrovi]